MTEALAFPSHMPRAGDTVGMRGWAMLLFAASLLAAPMALAQEPPQTPQVRAPAISTVEAREGEIATTATVTGTLVAREEVIVGVDVEGFKIVEVLAEVGDTVKAGQVLARLDAATIDILLAQNTSQLARAEAGIAQARASIAQAEAAKLEADSALERAQSLTGSGVTAQQTLDQRIAAASSAEAQLNSARQGLELAIADKALVEAQRREIDLNMTKTEIKAPTDGLVLSRSARIGAVASPSAEPLFRLAEEGDVELSADVTETSLASLSTGMVVHVTPAGFSQPVEGEVRLISPQIDAASRLGEMRVSLEANPALRPGAFARGVVEVASSNGVIIPLSALVVIDGEATVQAVVDGRIETRTVTTGLRTADRVEVLTGLEAGDVIVRRAGSFVRDGDAVTAVAQAESGDQ
ncbi:efflux RND transporter periplasmic adaptor subunit [Georhizobium profundi]|nr:efflux RND transporter periplasmic adaptor subunit [Georhizobium profundi]